jgi:FtsP/CotA-like multicopper oxidase with cupredoxin domain/peroxiredoxin
MRLGTGGPSFIVLGAGAWAILFASAVAQSLDAVVGPSANPVEGSWTYRSFVSDPNIAAEPNDLLFGRGNLNIAVSPKGEVTGTLGAIGWQLDLKGTYSAGAPATIRFQGVGTIGGERWVYDYLGYAVSPWPNGVNQRPAMVGTIVRTAAHSGGQAPAGVVAQWIAVKQDALGGGVEEENGPTAALPVLSPILAEPQTVDRLPAEHAVPDASSPSATPYRQIERQRYLETPRANSLKEVESLLDEGNSSAAPMSLGGAAAAASITAPVELVVDYAIFTIGNHQVRLRTYNGQLVGPVIRAKAGDVLRITLRNKLPPNPPLAHTMNSHHEWNTTNLHFHGLHVKPQGTPTAESDNVLLELAPTTDVAGAVQEYAVQIPPDHVAGTFWYHAHKHGAVSAQVASGMVGALIIESPDASYNLDSVPEVSAAKEHILVLQQIAYLKDSVTAPGEIEQSPDGSGANEGRMFAPGAWGALKRYVTVNGERIPTITMAPGEVHRLRLIDAGQREGMRLRIERSSGAVGPNRLTFHEIAVDGLPTGEIRALDELLLSPGYRSDCLVQPPTGAAGEYYLVDANAPAGSGADASPEPLRRVARIVISGAPVSGSFPTTSQLTPHRLPDIGPASATATQYAFYGIVLPPTAGINFYISRVNVPPGSVPPGSEYDPTNPRVLVKGATERWLVGARNTPPIQQFHPFHIHTNPFLVNKVFNEANADVTASEIGSPTWRDTLALKQGYTYELLTRYDDFEGSFVQHCHILDHEDSGMMELVRIDPAAPSPIPPITRNGTLPPSPGPRIAANVPRLGKTPSVLLFVKGSLCPHCMAQIVEAAKVLTGQNCEVAVISATTADDLRAFPASPFTLVADPDYRLFRQFGIFDGEPKHGTIVLDQKGVEFMRKVGDEPFMDMNAVQAALAAASGQGDNVVRQAAQN